MLEKISSAPATRTAALLVSTCLIVVLLFGLLFVQARSDLTLRRQQADFGAVQRIAHQLHDLGDVVTERVSPEGRQDIGESRTERFQIEVAKPTDPAADWCAGAMATASQLRLGAEGTQARDRKLRIIAVSKGPPLCARASFDTILGDKSHDDGPRDLAIEGPDGTVLMVLRGDGDWPDKPLASALVTSRSTGTNDDGAVKLADAAKRDGAIPIVFAGIERLLYAWPLDLGRPVTITREGQPDVICLPRQCRIDALGEPPSVNAALGSLSPFTKAVFGFAVVLLLLLVPLIKLASIDPNGSLSWVDVIGIMAAVPLIVATLVTACMVVLAWTDLRRDSDVMARTLSAAMARDLNREIDDSLKALQSHAGELGAGHGAPYPPPSPLLDAKAGKPPTTGKEQAALSDPSPLPLLVVQLRRAEDGQVLNAAGASNHPPQADITKRRYFVRLRSGDTLPCDPKAPAQSTAPPAIIRKPHCNSGWTYVIDQVPAANNGNSRMVALLADPLSRGGFLMAGKPLASAMDVPMPADFGFAVIDPVSLEVLHHSDPTREHSENFDQQLDTTTELKRAAQALRARCDAAAMGAPSPAPTLAFTGLYGGRKVRMTFGAACSPRWLVAVWYDKTRLENLALAPAYLAGTMMLAVGILLAIAMTLAAMVDRAALVRRLWPDPDPALDAARKQWLDRTIVPHILLGVLMLAGLFTASGDAMLLHGLLGSFVLTMLFAKPQANGQWHRGMQRLAGAALAGFACIALFAAACMVTAGQPPWRIVLHGLLLVAIALLATDGWRGRYTVQALLEAVVNRHAARPRHRKGDRLASVAHRLRRVLRLQAIALYLLAVIPPIAAYCAGAGVVRADRAPQNMLRLEDAREAGSKAISALQRSLYPCAPRENAASAPCGPAPARFTPHLFVEATLLERYRHDLGARSPLAAPVLYLWSPRQQDSAGSVANPGAAAAALLSNVRDAAQETGEAFPPDLPGKLAILVGDILFVVAAAIAAIYAVYRLLLLLANSLFGLQHFAFRALHPPHSPSQIREMWTSNSATEPVKAVFIDYPYRQFTDLQIELSHGRGFELFDLAIERDRLGDKTMALLTVKSWVVTGFESIVANRQLRLKTLSLLEQLTARPEANIFFFAQTLPLVRLRQTREREKREADAAGVAGVMNESESYRWAELFSEFITYTWNENTAAPVQSRSEADSNLDRLLAQIGSGDVAANVRKWAGANPGVAQVIADEMIRIPSDRIQDQIKSFSFTANQTASSLSCVYVEQIHEYMANFLGDYYQGQWVRCSKQEHLVMYHLAHDKFINTSNFSVINGLLARRLVRTDPNFQLMNESFGHWVRTLEHPDWFDQFRREAETGGTWSLLRLPLLLLVAAGSLLITYLNHDTSASILTLIPGAAATMPLLLSRLNRQQPAIA
ncbi:hypothetical protein V474_14375 [Novosphingobium barchaimii LL02]|uniref:Uncharacterized protein n=1 Tax=Novosphingobium barchaimii LL02 TaxID=1114963 RepID=A0A0J7XZJ8_9SPHN|nr:hypothetical protein [Novosphingobium barchaimii]KMS56633.1 hypothetical protein V474_14375 [Novosphingobium barchaimii LL02]